MVTHRFPQAETLPGYLRSTFPELGYKSQFFENFLHTFQQLDWRFSPYLTARGVPTRMDNSNALIGTSDGPGGTSVHASSYALRPCSPYKQRGRTI